MLCPNTKTLRPNRRRFFKDEKAAERRSYGAVVRESPSEESMGAEAVRLQEARAAKIPWKKWGPYLSERQWGTVREDYSEDGNAGITFRMITLDLAPITGARMVLRASATTNSCYVSVWPCGTVKIPFSKNECSA